MNIEETQKRPDDVRRMFTRIASRYDLLNRLMTLGQDHRWRRETIRRLDLSQDDRLLDIGAGTGDLAFEAARQQPDLKIVACDFTSAMIHHGKRFKPIRFNGSSQMPRHCLFRQILSTQLYPDFYCGMSPISTGHSGNKHVFS